MMSGERMLNSHWSFVFQMSELSADNGARLYINIKHMPIDPCTEAGCCRSVCNLPLYACVLISFFLLMLFILG